MFTCYQQEESSRGAAQDFGYICLLPYFISYRETIEMLDFLINLPGPTTPILLKYTKDTTHPTGNPQPPEVGLGETMAELAVPRGNSARRALFSFAARGE